MNLIKKIMKKKKEKEKEISEMAQQKRETKSKMKRKPYEKRKAMKSEIISKTDERSGVISRRKIMIINAEYEKKNIEKAKYGMK